MCVSFTLAFIRNTFSNNNVQSSVQIQNKYFAFIKKSRVLRNAYQRKQKNINIYQIRRRYLMRKYTCVCENIFFLQSTRYEEQFAIAF